MTKNSRKILLTGGAGFIGSYLAPKLLDEGYLVTILDNLSSGKIENLKAISNNTEFEFKRGDICDKNAVQDAIVGVDAVVHLAALVDVSASVADPTTANEVNVTGTLNLLQQTAQNKIEKFVFASSTAVYGDASDLPVKEDNILKPISPYAATKVAGEAYCSAFANCFGLNTVALRFFNVYGLRNENSPYSGVISKFLKEATYDEELIVNGDGEQTRDFIHVNDVVQAILLTLESKGLSGEIFNICTGSSTSINKLAETCKKIVNESVKINHGPPRMGDIKHSYGNPIKAQQKLGFKSKIGLFEGLNLLYEETTK